jgi:hypothetical protein
LTRLLSFVSPVFEQGARPWQLLGGDGVEPAGGSQNFFCLLVAARYFFDRLEKGVINVPDQAQGSRNSSRSKRGAVRSEALT